MSINFKQLKESFRAFDNTIKSRGICLISLHEKSVLFKYGFDVEMEERIGDWMKSKVIECYFDRFNSLLGETSRPNTLTMKMDYHIESLLFTEDHHVLLAIIDNSNPNLGRVKNELNKVNKQIQI